MQAKSAPDVEGFLDKGQSEWLRGGEWNMFILNSSSNQISLKKEEKK